MSFLGKIFGGSKYRENAPTPQEAIQRLREIEDMLVKKQEYLENKMESELVIAKSNGTKNKRVALQALRRKKFYEKQLRRIDGTLTTIEFQREALQNANTNKEVMKIMGYASNALKKTHADIDVNKVHDMMDDLQEQQEIANEISEAISIPIGFGVDVDENELMRELEELEQEALDEELLSVAGPASEKLPSPAVAKSQKKPKQKKEEDDADADMRKLAEWAT